MVKLISIKLHRHIQARATTEGLRHSSLITALCRRANVSVKPCDEEVRRMRTLDEAFFKDKTKEKASKRPRHQREEEEDDATQEHHEEYGARWSTTQHTRVTKEAPTHL